MGHPILVATLLGLLALTAQAASPTETAKPQTDTCEQIRAQIKAQTGVPPKVNTELLQKLSGRPDCAFTAAEVYRAAWGDKPLPTNDGHGRGVKRGHDDDD
ncbi:MAG: hypothetical protein RBS40_16840 [Rhodocyclaceae bacterium]|jgi:hypothetical protein|nr:hypothetical protein [Rhodocyclaceae bacterium]